MFAFAGVLTKTKKPITGIGFDSLKKLKPIIKWSSHLLRLILFYLLLNRIQLHLLL